MVVGLEDKGRYKYSEYEYQDNSYFYGVDILLILKIFKNIFHCNLL